MEVESKDMWVEEMDFGFESVDISAGGLDEERYVMLSWTRLCNSVVD
jgi:hypothetical protein